MSALDLRLPAPTDPSALALFNAVRAEIDASRNPRDPAARYAWPQSTGPGRYPPRELHRNVSDDPRRERIEAARAARRARRSDVQPVVKRIRPHSRAVFIRDVKALVDETHAACVAQEVDTASPASTAAGASAIGEHFAAFSQAVDWHQSQLRAQKNDQKRYRRACRRA